MPIIEGVDSGGTPRAPLVDSSSRHLAFDAYGQDTGGTARVLSADTSGRLYPVPSTWAVSGTTLPNAAGTISKAGVASQRHYVTAFSVVTFGSATAADVTVKLLDGTVGTAWYDVIGAGAARGTRLSLALGGAPIMLTAGQAAQISVTAPGTVCQLASNMLGYTR